LSLKNIDIFEMIKEINKAYSIKVFYLDEIQSLSDWENILKNIYDILNVSIVFTGSSMIDLVK
jgi:predicted AAA+ superfamily ATPase